MAKYYKLGKTATMFYDPVVKLKIVGENGVGKLNTKNSTKRIENALRHGHIKEATEKEYKEFIENAGVENTEKLEEATSSGVDFSKMNKDTLIAHYKEAYDVTEDDVVTFSKLNKADMIKFLEEGDDEEEDDDE